MPSSTRTTTKEITRGRNLIDAYSLISTQKTGMKAIRNQKMSMINDTLWTPGRGGSRQTFTSLMLSVFSNSDWQTGGRGFQCSKAIQHWR